MQDVDVEAVEDLCPLCPRTDYERRRVPQSQEAQMAELRCGHQVHTHCLINRMHTRDDATCNECDTPVMTEAQVEFYRGHDNAPTMETLWQNEEFRNDVKEYKKLTGKFSKMDSIYKKEFKVIHNRFKENVLTSIAFIEGQKRQGMNEVKALESRKLFKRAESAVTRKLNYMRRKWDVSQWRLRQLNDIEGAPKIKRIVYHRYRRGSVLKYIFRLNL